MNRKSESNLKSNRGSLKTAPILFGTVLTVSAQGQNLTMTVSHDRSTDAVPMHLLMGTFITSEAASAQEAVKNAAINAAEGKVLTAVAMHSLPIPFVGALPVDWFMKGFNKFRKPTVKGFEVTFLQGTSADIAIRADGASFTLPGQGLQALGQAGTPMLVRVRSSSKDSARIVDSTRVSYKMNGSGINPASKETLGIERDGIDCTVESRESGDFVLTPRAPLAPGEYAVIANSAQGGAAWAWDFRVIQ